MRVFSSRMCIAAIVAATACAGDKISAPNSGPPFTSGSITAVDATGRYLVEITAGTTAPPKVFFRITTSTSIERPDGSAGTAADLRIGAVVAVWAASVVAGSEPPEISARAVLLYQH
jgi:hypothetical protein